MAAYLETAAAWANGVAHWLTGQRPSNTSKAHDAWLSQQWHREQEWLARQQSDACGMLAAGRHAADCICAEHGCFASTANCTPTPLCRSQLGSVHQHVAHVARSPAIIVPVMCVSTQECDHQRVIVRRLLVSLFAVGTTIPVVVFSPNASHFEGLGAPVRSARHFRPPAWARRYHASSFLKMQLHAREAALRDFDHLIALDTDMQVVQNIDHLRGIPTPAFVVHEADGGLNSGLQVLRPDPALYARFLGLPPTGGLRGDGGDQQALRQLVPHFYELPLGYNLRPHYSLNQGNATMMCDAHVIHLFDRRAHDKGARPSVMMRECRR